MKFEIIERLNLLSDKLIAITQDIKNCAINGEFERLQLAAINRDRLIALIFENLKKLDIENVDVEKDKLLIEKFKQWQINFQQKYNLMQEIDFQSIAILESDKQTISDEIAKVFKSRNSLKKFNLNTLTG